MGVLQLRAVKLYRTCPSFDFSARIRKLCALVRARSRMSDVEDVRFASKAMSFFIALATVRCADIEVRTEAVHEVVATELPGTESSLSIHVDAVDRILCNDEILYLHSP